MTDPNLNELLDTLSQRIEDLEDALQKRYRIRATVNLTHTHTLESGLNGTTGVTVNWGKLRNEWRFYLDDETFVRDSSALMRKTIALHSDKLVAAIQEAAAQHAQDVEQAIDALDATIRSLEAT